MQARIILTRGRVTLGVFALILASVGFYSAGRALASSSAPSKPAKPATAQASPFQYVAKYVCVNEVGPASSAFISGPSYRTAINIHNPNTTTVQILKKAVVALPEGPQFGKIGQLFPVAIPPDGAFEIDCKDIKAVLLGAAQPIGDGLVVIMSPSPLDVWAVYTQRQQVDTAAGTGLGTNIDVVWVPPQERAQ